MQSMTDETYNEASEPRSDGHLNDESFNGYANRETWAFNLHWSNDAGLYDRTLEDAANHLEWTNPDASDRQLGEVAVNLWRDTIRELEAEGAEVPDTLRMMRDEVGSWWRIDYKEVGEAVREALDAESD